MGLIQSIFGDSKKNQGLNKEQIRILDILRNLRQVLTGCEVLFGPINSELSEEKRREILIHINDYNKNIKLTQSILHHLDPNLGFDYEHFKLEENQTFLKIKNKESNSHLYSKVKKTHAKMHNLIQDTKKRYISKNLKNEEEPALA